MQNCVYLQFWGKRNALDVLFLLSVLLVIISTPLRQSSEETRSLRVGVNILLLWWTHVWNYGHLDKGIPWLEIEKWTFVSKAKHIFLQNSHNGFFIWIIWIYEVKHIYQDVNRWIFKAKIVFCHSITVSQWAWWIFLYTSVARRSIWSSLCFFPRSF